MSPPPPLSESTIHDRFEVVASQTPNATAFRYEGTSFTYGDLAKGTNAVAERLGHAGAASGQIFVVLLAGDPVAETSAILGVLSSGGIAVPVEAHQPMFRVRQIVEHCGSTALLAHPSQSGLARQAAPDAVLIEFPECGRDDAMNRGLVSPDAPAYICYTSGSTGEPKGVVITHRQVLARVDALSSLLDFRSTDRHTLLNSLGTGHGLSTVWRALLTGGTLLPARVREQGVGWLLDWLNAERVTIFAASATLVRTLGAHLTPSARLESIRMLRLGGESVMPADFALFKRHFPPPAVFINAYSCSEASTVTLHVLTHADELNGDVVPIGQALPGCSVRLLDSTGVEVPFGETGEIVVDGPIVASGYYRDPVRSASVFEPLAGDGTTRRLRTGDLARQTPDGLVHVGRRDFQVKIRGFRVELEGVEALLSKAPGVDQAAVFVREGGDDPMLVALVVARRDTVTLEALRAFATAHLPFGSVPHRFVIVDALPLGPSGKLDRTQLPLLAETALANEPGPAATSGSAIEEELATIWHEVLGHRQFGCHDDFLIAGGDSLRAMRVLTRVHQRFAIDVPLQDFLTTPTIASLASAVEERRRTLEGVDEVELAMLLDEVERGGSDAGGGGG